MRISDWSSDVCSSDLATGRISHGRVATMQSTFEQTGRVRHFQRHRHAVHTMHVECNTVGMEMDVQQPGNQTAAVEIAHFGTVETVTGPADFADSTAFDEDTADFIKFSDIPIYDGCVSR